MHLFKNILFNNIYMGEVMNNISQKINNFYYKINKDKTFDLLETSKVSDTFSQLIEKKELEEIVKLLKSLQKNHPESLWIGDTIHEYSVLASTPIHSQKNDKTVYVPKDVEILMDKLIMSEDDQMVLPISELSQYDELKKLMKQVIEGVYHTSDKIVFPFLISNNIRVKGKIIFKQTGLTPYKLISIKENRSNNAANKLRISFLGDKTQVANSETFQQRLYTYIFYTSSDNSEDRIQYTVLSPKPLPLDEIEITGMIIPITDSINVGHNAKIEKGAEIIYVSDFQPVVREITDEQFTDIIKDYKGNYDKLYKGYFSIYRHPTTFEKFLLTWLFSSEKRFNNVGGYPSHFGWIGDTGSGKTMISECLTHIFSAHKISPNATFKSLLPNFGGDRIDMGAYCKADRFLVTEEFFRLVFKSKKAENDFGLFNDLLEWQNNRVNSGKGTSIDGIVAKPTATMMWVTNYGKYKATDFFEVLSDVDSAFLARNILYVQTRAHLDFVNSKKSNLSLDLDSDNGAESVGMCVLPEKNPRLVELRDYLVKKKCKFGGVNPKQIYEEGKKLLPDNIIAKQIYESRSIKHIVSIIDGVTKLNYILEGRTGELRVTSKDVKDAKDIWEFIIYSWSDDISKAPLERREKYLTTKEFKIYQYFKKNPNSTVYNCEKETKIYPTTIVQKLVSCGLLKEIVLGQTKSYIPYWYDQMEASNEQVDY
jgi:hypothetical protein